MIWMNKHCFNGLYRVNRKGLFNVPFNNKVSGRSFDEDNLRHIGEYLRKNKVNINCVDFEKIRSRVRPGDFVYFDSPYFPTIWKNLCPEKAEIALVKNNSFFTTDSLDAFF